jgi:RNA polymerase sigma factor (TIGR02999 family)
MNEVTQVLGAIDQGDSTAAEQLLPLVYDELRRLAAQKLAQEKPGQTLQPTGLVHEAYIRLVDSAQPQQWRSRGHFFAAAAEAMRRILVEAARRRGRRKRGGGRRKVDIADHEPACAEPDLDVLALDEALTRLSAAHAAHAELVKLRYFAGLTLAAAAAALNVSTATAERRWRYARAWLARALDKDSIPDSL